MRILIIGGTGNISTAITGELLRRGHDLTLFNRGHTQVPGARTIVGDRTDRPAFEARMRQEGAFDCVIDMVAYAAEEGESLVRAFGGRCGQFIFCSTVDVYAKPAPVYPVTEGHPRGQSAAFPYAYRKGRLEETLERAAAEGAFNLTILRPAATYNDTSAPLGILDSGLAVMRRIREGRPVIVMGDGLSLWTSSHRDDVGLAFANAVGNPATYGRAYTVAGDEALTWLAYYDAARRALDAPPIEFVGIPTWVLVRAAPKSCDWCGVNFKYDNIFDNSAAKADLGYRYTITWAEGVRRMVAHHDAASAIDAAQDHPAYDALVSRFTCLNEYLADEFAPLDV
jgi:nucleoside-diphosphate-sugar epimerase